MVPGVSMPRPTVWHRGNRPGRGVPLGGGDDPRKGDDGIHCIVRCAMPHHHGPSCRCVEPHRGVGGRWSALLEDPDLVGRERWTLPDHGGAVDLRGGKGVATAPRRRHQHHHTQYLAPMRTVAAHLALLLVAQPAEAQQWLPADSLPLIRRAIAQRTVRDADTLLAGWHARRMDRAVRVGDRARWHSCRTGDQGR